MTTAQIATGWTFPDSVRASLARILLVGHGYRPTDQSIADLCASPDGWKHRPGVWRGDQAWSQRMKAAARSFNRKGDGPWR